MKKSVLSAVLLGMLALFASSAFAQVKVFWTTSGKFGPFDIRGLIPSLPEDKKRDITIPISMWVIDHPKGLVLFDTGNNVAISDGNCKAYWTAGFCDFLKPSQTRADVIDMQLKKLGYSADKVKVVITSHGHLDHIGNIKLFPNAIQVMQKAELYQAWWPEKFQGRTNPGAFVMGDFDGPAREFNYVELSGDYDLFGDGVITVLSTPGHTLGHQSVKIKAAGGTYVLTQDAVWMKENLEGFPAGLNFSVKAYTDSISRLKAIRDIEGAQLFMAHDQDQFAAMGGKWYK
jgi:N-acyl homoserine lactone hydrolase